MTFRIQIYLYLSVSNIICDDYAKYSYKQSCCKGKVCPDSTKQDTDAVRQTGKTNVHKSQQIQSAQVMP